MNDAVRILRELASGRYRFIDTADMAVAFHIADLLDRPCGQERAGSIDVRPLVSPSPWMALRALGIIRQQVDENSNIRHLVPRRRTRDIFCRPARPIARWSVPLVQLNVAKLQIACFDFRFRTINVGDQNCGAVLARIATIDCKTDSRSIPFKPVQARSRMTVGTGATRRSTSLIPNALPYHSAARSRSATGSASTSC